MFRSCLFSAHPFRASTAVQHCHDTIPNREYDQQARELAVPELASAATKALRDLCSSTRFLVNVQCSQRDVHFIQEEGGQADSVPPLVSSHFAVAVLMRSRGGQVDKPPEPTAGLNYNCLVLFSCVPVENCLGSTMLQKQLAQTSKEYMFTFLLILYLQAHRQCCVDASDPTAFHMNCVPTITVLQLQTPSSRMHL